MKHLAKKDYTFRRAFSKEELLYLIIKSLVSDLRLPIKYRFFFFSRLNVYKKCSRVRIVNRCLLSSRAGGVIRDFRMSRMFFRELANFGQLAGFMKSSW
jgi:succinate dehydrogenase (ubiquinone) iron-sulfur subunit